MVAPFCGEDDPRKYVRLAALLRSHIHDGTLKPGNPPPSITTPSAHRAVNRVDGTIVNAKNTQPTSPLGDAVMTALPAESMYLWVMIPTGIAGVAPDIAGAFAALDRAMDQHADAQAWAIFRASTMHDWPYVRLIPDAARSRTVHDWMKANVARANLRRAQRNQRRRAQGKGAPLQPPKSAS